MRWGEGVGVDYAPMTAPTEVLIRVHEVALKGKNRPAFIRALVKHVRRATAGIGVARVWSDHVVVHAELEAGADWEAVRARLKQTPGAVKFAAAQKTPPDYDDIAAAVSAGARGRDFDTFRISAHRSDKRFPLTSQQLNISLGALVEHETRARVDLKRPTLDIRVDVFPQAAYVWVEEEAGLGGLPVGTGGRVAVLMSGGIDSPVAAGRMIRRGCRATLIHFHSFPLVEGRSREKARELAAVLNAYQLDTRLYLAPFAELQRKVILTVPGPLRVVVYRRFMLRIAEALARRERAQALVTGESLGQVGSQTLTNIATVGEAATMPLLRPLIGMDKAEIVTQARALGTFDISILPDEDCCTLFVPRSPSTAVSLKEVRDAERELDVDALVAEAAAGAEVYELHADPRPHRNGEEERSVAASA